MTTQEIYYFEDFSAGDVFVSDSLPISEREMLEFARRYDPQPFHTGDTPNTAPLYNELIASGWHTASVCMRLLVDAVLRRTANLGSPGLDSLRWATPMRGGDVVTAGMKILEARRSRSRPDRGILKVVMELHNQQGAELVSIVAAVIVACRGVND